MNGLVRTARCDRVRIDRRLRVRCVEALVESIVVPPVEIPNLHLVLAAEGKRKDPAIERMGTSDGEASPFAVITMLTFRTYPD